MQFRYQLLHFHNLLILDIISLVIYIITPVIFFLYGIFFSLELQSFSLGIQSEVRIPHRGVARLCLEPVPCRTEDRRTRPYLNYR